MKCKKEINLMEIFLAFISVLYADVSSLLFLKIWTASMHLSSAIYGNEYHTLTQIRTNQHINQIYVQINRHKIKAHYNNASNNGLLSV